jgi:hypothetical protein
MTISVAPLSAPALRRPSTQLLGTLGLLASPALALEAPLQRLVATAAGRDVVMGLCSLTYLAGWAAAAGGRRRLRAPGDGRGARAVFGLQMAGLALAAVWAAWYVVAPGPERSGVLRVADAAWPLSHAFMLVVFGMIVRAGRLRGWRRYPALLCGLALPAAVALNAAGAPAAAGVVFPILTTLGFALLGLAVRTAERTAVGAAGLPTRAALAAALLMLAGVRPAHAQPTLVANGGFEGGGAGGIPTGWYNANPGGSNAGLTSAAHTGLWGAYFSSFGPSGFATPLGFSALGQTLATTAGQAYTITFWARNNSTADVVNGFQLLFGGATLFDAMLTNTAYQQFTVTGVAAGTTTELVFRGYNRTSRNVLDDVSVVAAATTPPPSVVPEPSTVVLSAAGLSALGAAARRRRRA